MSKPRIGYTNLLETGTVTASSEATGFDVENVFDWLLYDWWKPNAAGNAEINCSFSTYKNADYLAIAGHTLGENGARAQLFYGDGTDYIPLGRTLADPYGLSSIFAPTTNRVGYMQMPVLGQNLLTYSEDFSNAAWSKSSVTITADTIAAPDGTTTADVLTYAAVSSANVRSAGVSAANGDMFTFSIYLKAASATNVNIQMVTAGGGAPDSEFNSEETVSIGTTWQRFTKTVTLSGLSTDNAIYIYLVTRDSVARTIHAWGAQLEESATAGTYIKTIADPFDNGAKYWKVKFYAKQNLLTYSEQFDNAAWLGSTFSIAANSATAPDGTTTADSLIEDSGSGQKGTYQSYTYATADHTLSVYAKAGTRDWIRIGTGTNHAWFNVSTGVVGTEVLCTGSMVLDSNGFYRCSVTMSLTAGTDNFYIFIANGDNVTAYTGDGASLVYIWGAQLENAPSAGAYQVTTTAAVSNNIGYAGVVSFGASLELENGMMPGFKPPIFGNEDEYINSISDNGAFIGRSLVRYGVSFDIKQSFMEPSFIRASYIPFLEHAQAKPFFFSWDNADYNNEAAFCWADGKIDIPGYSHTNYMEHTLKVNGRIIT